MKSKWFTWLLVAILAYAYITYFKEHGSPFTASKKFLDLQSSPIESSGTSLSTSKPSLSFSDRVLSWFGTTEAGKKILQQRIQEELDKTLHERSLPEYIAESSGNIHIIDSVLGTGSLLQCGDKAEYAYRAYLSGDIEFDSAKKNTPVTIQVGAGQVIKGLDLGLVGMKVGGTRKVYIPAHLAFDDPLFPNPTVPPLSLVIYTLDLLQVKKASPSGFAFNLLNITPGTGPSIHCGSPFEISFQRTPLIQEPFQQQPSILTTLLGKGDIPLELEQLLLGKQEGTILRITTAMIDASQVNKTLSSSSVSQFEDFYSMLKEETHMDIMIKNVTERTPYRPLQPY